MNQRRKVILSLALVFVSLVSLVGATLAWMTMSASPIVSDMDLYLVSGNGEAFLIAKDEDGKPGEYGLLLQYSESTAEETLLRPVSFSGAQYAFLLPDMALDGRVAGGRYISVNSLSGPAGQSNASASQAADSEALAGYVYKTDFWMHSDVSKITVSLTPGFTSSSGVPVQGCYTVGEPVWNDRTYVHDNGGNGAEYAVRIGFFFHGTEANPDDTRFVIYEPNADGGKATVIDGVPFTASADNSKLDLTGNNPNVKLIQQGTSGWTEQDPILRTEVNYNSASFLSGDLDLIHLEAGEDRKVTMFIWLEGQDRDCVNSISAGRILANITFAARVYGDMPLRPE